MRFLRAAAALAVLIFAAPSPAIAGPDEDWNAILAFDKGPGREPTNRQEALELARGHLNRQLEAIKAFIAAYPNDPRTYDAQIRSAGILAAVGKMDDNPRLVEMAMAQLVQLEKDASLPSDKRADVAFRRISLYMQGAQSNPQHLRKSIADTVENFATRFPDDKRSARLLVEAATLWDDTPSRKRDMLERARLLTREEPLKMRISDDLKRIDMLNKPLDLRFQSIQGREVDLKQYRGMAVVIVFWSAESPQSLIWLRNFRSVAAKMSNSRFAVLTLSLDEQAAGVQSVLRELKVDWPTYFDGKGWENAIARPWGINALPTVWMVDKKGLLRSINASASYESWIRKLILEQ